MGQCCAGSKQPNSVETSAQSNQTSQEPDQRRLPSSSNGTIVASTSTTMISSAKTDTFNGTLITSQSTGAEDDDTRERILQFYRVHSPDKANDDERISEIVRRFKGREEELFATLARKYTVTEQPDSATNGHSGHDTQQARTSTITSTPDAGSITTASSPPTQAQAQAQPLQMQPPLNAAPMDHPILDSVDERRKSESQSLTGKDKKKKSITPPLNADALKPQPQQSQKTSKVAALADGMFKIEITKPNKKTAFARKVLGTSLFGDGTPTTNNNNNTTTTATTTTYTTKLAGHSHQNSGSLGQRSLSLFVKSPGDSKDMFDDDDDDLPKFGTNMTRSNTLTLNRAHKDNLDKRRQSSLAVRRNQTRQNLPIKINRVWALFAQHVLEDRQRVKQEEEEEELEQLEQEQAQLKQQQQHLSKIQSIPSNDTAATDLEETPEPNDILDAIINSSDDKAGDKSEEQHQDKAQNMSMEVLAIDPRLFHDAKEKSRSMDGSGDDEAERESTSSDSNASDKEVDVYALQVSNVQFNVVLNNHNIQVSPDMIAGLIWLLLDVNGLLDDEIKSRGLESDNLHTNPMKERGFHAKQFKRIHKCIITYGMIETLMTKIADGAISRHDRQLHPKSLSYLKRNFVIWDKIFTHLLSKTALNVEEEYLYGTLQESDLRDGEKIVDMLSSLDAHWQHRVQLMEHIDDKLNGGSTMERDMFFASILFNNENFIRVLTGWSCQLTDDRSGVARAAVTLLPAVLSSIMLCIQFPAVLFDEERIIHPIYDGIFTLVKNRRLKDMADDAYESLIQVTDILGQVAWDLEDYELMTMIINILEQHSGIKVEKHDKCRESCIGGIGFLLYGIEGAPDDNVAKIAMLKKRSLDTNDAVQEVIATPIGALSEKDRESGADDDDGKMPDVDLIRMRSSSAVVDAKIGTKLAKEMQRKELLQNEAFVASFGVILKNGVTDKSESARRKAFKMLQRLEKEQDGELWTELQTKWDLIIKKKFESWKKMNAKKSSTKLRPKRSTKKSSSAALLRKKGSSKKGQQSELKLKNQVDTMKKKKSEEDAALAEMDEAVSPDVNAATRSSGMKIMVTSSEADGASAEN